MFVIITYNDLKCNPIVDANKVSSIYDGCTLWVSQYLLQKCFSLSDRYFENVRSKYKRRLPASQKPIYLTKRILGTNIWDNCGYILDDINVNWRWMLNNEFYYDYDHIPKRYRKILPYKEELFTFARAMSTRDNHLNKSMIINHIQSESTIDTYYYFQKCGFDDDLSDRLSIVVEWLKFIIWVVRHNLYAIYGFDEQLFYTQCAVMLKENGIDWLSMLSSEELKDKVLKAPCDDERFSTFVLRLCGKRRRKRQKNE